MQLQERLETEGVFVLSDLPAHSEAGVDTKLYTTQAFTGFKFLPPGLHFFIFSPPTSPSGFGPGVPFRQGVFHFYPPSHSSQTIFHHTYSPSTLSLLPQSASERPLISPASLKALDKSLAPYPEKEIGTEWTQLSDLITVQTLNRVLGEERTEGEGWNVDGGMQARWEEVEDVKFGEAVQLSKFSEISEEGEGVDKVLGFAKIEIKRSWPEGASGEERTKWSVDKSHLLQSVLEASFHNEFQLSHILFLLVHSYSSLTHYTTLLTLLTSSSSALSSPNHLPLFQSFLIALTAHLAHLDRNVFETELPELEMRFLGALGTLHRNLRDAQMEDLGWRDLVLQWEALRIGTMERFGWTLGELSLAQHRGALAERGEGEVDLDELEDGEDGPVIVEL